MTPHAALVLECARGRPDAAALTALAQAAPDWSKVLAFAAAHDLTSLCYWRLQQCCPGAVPAEVLDRLQQHFRRNAERNLLMTRELFRAIETLASGGVTAAALKGPVLAWSLYDTPGAREYLDLDLLVRRADMSRARELLYAAGYRPAAGVPGQGEARLHRYGGQLVLIRDAPDVILDLHWDLAPRSLNLSLSAEALWPQLVPLSVAAHSVLSFDDSTQFLLAAVHGGKHGWSTLAWLADMAALLDREAVDWDRIAAAARAGRLTRSLLLAVNLLSDLLQAPIPKPIAVQARADASVASMTRETEAFLLEGPSGNAMFPRKLVYQVRLTEGRHRQAIVLWRKITEPNLADWQSKPLRPSLFGWYTLSRPFRLALKYLRLLKASLVRSR